MPVNVPEALKLRHENNLSYSQIGAIQGVSKTAICKAIKDLPNPNDVSDFIDNRSDIFAAQQLRVLQAITDDDIKKARLAEKAMFFGVLYDKERVNRGQATSYNMVDIRALVQAMPVGSGVQQENPEPPSGLEGVRGDRKGE